jgi:hypothetical protein
MSMDSNGKVIMAKHNEVQQANVLKLDAEDVKDGEPMTLVNKDLGSCEIYPQTLSHNPNGRYVARLNNFVPNLPLFGSPFSLFGSPAFPSSFVVVCGDGEYIIHTALSFRNKSFGQALEFVWAADSSEYAVRESSSKVKIFKNFKEKSSLKPDFSAEGRRLTEVTGFVTIGLAGDLKTFAMFVTCHARRGECIYGLSPVGLIPIYRYLWWNPTGRAWSRYPELLRLGQPHACTAH